MEEPSVLKTIKERRSVRSYLDRPVEDKKLDLILESARLAPSASNAQPWHFYVVKDREKIKALSGMPLGSQRILNSFLSQAPVVIAATAGPMTLLQKAAAVILNKKWYFLDVGIAVEHMVLTAWELGIGSCWVGWFDEKNIRKVLNIPEEHEIVALLTLGYPGDFPPPPFPKHRKKLGEIATFIS